MQLVTQQHPAAQQLTRPPSNNGSLAVRSGAHVLVSTGPSFDPGRSHTRRADDGGGFKQSLIIITPRRPGSRD